MSTGRLTTTSYVVLGMVAMRGPSTPYELKRAVNHSVGYFWPFPHAQLYSEPKRLLEMGLLDVHAEEEGRRRQTYTISPEGEVALRSWLAEPTVEQLQIRDVAELKLFFGEFARAEDILGLARGQIVQHQDRIAVYEGMQARFAERDDIADRMVPLRLGLELEYAALRFWQQLEKERS
ncbi:MAG: transcriptional regulator PadR family protein [Nocardioides sp.]|nr:transcriptional regulator PadR family protein [Nocardioides sp.]